MDTPEQAQLRRHMAELRRATRGLGHDFAIEFETLDTKIARLGSLTAKETKYALMDIEDDFSALGRSIGTEFKRLPGQVAGGLTSAGAAIASGAARAGAATAEALLAAGHATKEGTKNALASMAGMRRTPMKEWSKPGSDDPPP
ncbi:MAG: hypothetical protein L3K14_02235 [Thermoplasmata archaeon]|nr:hypothetical protein [Thermoplasmata archaeon]